MQNINTTQNSQHTTIKTEVKIGKTIFRVASVYKGEQRLTELDRLITKSYEEMVSGKIPRDILLNLLEKYQYEKRETAELADELTLRLMESKESEQYIRKWIDLMKRNMAVEEIDRNLLMRLIDKIIVGQKKEETGVDYQNITILYNLVGAVE